MLPFGKKTEKKVNDGTRENVSNDTCKKVKDVYVVTTTIISNRYFGKGDGPMCFTMYFLAKHIEGEYYELFSGAKIEKAAEPEDKVVSQNFNTPYVEEATPLTEYLKNPDMEEIDNESLFSFITGMNLDCLVEAASKEDTEEEAEEV